MICFPLDNTPYEAKDMGTYLATRTRGVFSSDGNLAVTPGESGLSVSVSPGLAWLKWSDYWGTAALQEQALTLDLDTADGALKRIDAIVCRLDKVNNRAEIVVKKGAPSSAPIVVPPVRDANYDELYIATVLIGAGVISISASAITDQRLNEEYCGLMRDGVTGIPTASLHAQAQQILTELTDALNAQIVRQSAEFDAWFDDLKGKLGEDPATALQQQVDNLNAAVVGDAFQASGTPVSIAYAGAQRIASITAYGENAQGGTTEAPVALTGISSVTVNDDVTELPIPRPLRRVGDVRDVCVTRQEYEGTEKLVVTYNVGFVELDGTEASHLYEGMFYLDYSASWPTPANRVNGVCSHYPYGAYGKGKIGLTDNGAAVVYNPNGDYTGDEGGLANWKAYLAAQKEAGTPVQVAYQLAAPEVYATDPLTIDNAAGPLNVMTGGELEVRMTELVGSRSPEIVAKMDMATYDADGDGVVDEAAAAPWSGITGKPDTFPPSTHNHDDRYYTETETDDKLAGKANSSHTHGMGDISGVLPSTKGGTGANKSVLAISSAVVTTESQGYANVNISTNATICAVVSQGSATGQCYSISVIDPKTGGFSIQVKDYNGNVVANKTIRINYIAYSI